MDKQLLDTCFIKLLEKGQSLFPPLGALPLQSQQTVADTFQEFNPEQLSTIQEAVTTLRLAPGTSLTNQGSPCFCMALLLQGEGEVVWMHEGESKSRWSLKRGDFMGVEEFFQTAGDFMGVEEFFQTAGALDGELVRETVTVEMTGDENIVMLLPYKNLAQLHDSDPQCAQKLMRLLSEVHESKQAPHISSLQCNSTADKCNRLEIKALLQSLANVYLKNETLIGELDRLRQVNSFPQKGLEQLILLANRVKQVIGDDKNENKIRTELTGSDTMNRHAVPSLDGLEGIQYLGDVLEAAKQKIEEQKAVIDKSGSITNPDNVEEVTTTEIGTLKAQLEQSRAKCDELGKRCADLEATCSQLQSELAEQCKMTEVGKYERRSRLEETNAAGSSENAEAPSLRSASQKGVTFQNDEPVMKVEAERVSCQGGINDVMFGKGEIKDKPDGVDEELKKWKFLAELLSEDLDQICKMFVFLLTHIIDFEVLETFTEKIIWTDKEINLLKACWKILHRRKYFSSAYASLDIDAISDTLRRRGQNLIEELGRSVDDDDSDTEENTIYNRKHDGLEELVAPVLAMRKVMRNVNTINSPAVSPKEGLRKRSSLEKVMPNATSSPSSSPRFSFLSGRTPFSTASPKKVPTSLDQEVSKLCSDSVLGRIGYGQVSPRVFTRSAPNSPFASGYENRPFVENEMSPLCPDRRSTGEMQTPSTMTVASVGLFKSSQVNSLRVKTKSEPSKRSSSISGVDSADNPIRNILKNRFIGQSVKRQTGFSSSYHEVTPRSTRSLGTPETSERFWSFRSIRSWFSKQ